MHENGCLTAIDNSRQAVYGYDQRVEVFGSGGMAASENPPRTPPIVRDADGTRGAALPTSSSSATSPSYVREWEAFVAAVARRGAAGGRSTRAPRS